MANEEGSDVKRTPIFRRRKGWKGKEWEITATAQIIGTSARNNVVSRKSRLVGLAILHAREEMKIERNEDGKNTPKRMLRAPATANLRKHRCG